MPVNWDAQTRELILRDSTRFGNLLATSHDDYRVTFELTHVGDVVLAEWRSALESAKNTVGVPITITVEEDPGSDRFVIITREEDRLAFALGLPDLNRRMTNADAMIEAMCDHHGYTLTSLSRGYGEWVAGLTSPADLRRTRDLFWFQQRCVDILRAAPDLRTALENLDPD